MCSIDVVQAQKEAAKASHCPLEVRASDADNAMGAEYFSKNKEQIRADLLKHGAVWLRGFDLMKSVNGHRDMYEALQMEPCLDPLHSSGLRKFASERDALYEEVRPFGLSLVFFNRLHFVSHYFYVGEQAFSSRSLHWFARRIDDEAYCRLCGFCVLPKGD